MKPEKQKKRKIKKHLERIKSNPHVPNAQKEAVKRKLAEAHIDIRDAINNNLLYQEQQAVSKLKENPKYFYSYAKKFSKQSRTISMLFDSEDNVCSDPHDIADLFQKQFTSVFSDPSKTDINAASFESPVLMAPFTDEMLNFSVDDIIEAINEIKPNAACGPDEIPEALLKKCSSSIAIPIEIIWRRSLDTGVVPDAYKLSYVAPLHKKDSRAYPENYRPISLTSHIVKVFERVLRKKLVNHMVSNNLLCDKQHGFQAGRSCLTQLLHHFDDVTDAITSNNDFDSIYLDYAKAFDKVDHQLLLKKLEIYGFNSHIISWINSFLVGRCQIVVVAPRPGAYALEIGERGKGCHIVVVLRPGAYALQTH